MGAGLLIARSAPSFDKTHGSKDFPMSNPDLPSSSDGSAPPAPTAKKRRPPMAGGPSPFVPAIAAFSRDPLGFLRAATERHGNVFTIHALAFRMTFVMSAALRRDFFAAKDDVLDLQPIVGRILKAITGTEHFKDKNFTNFSNEHMRSAIWRPTSTEPFLRPIRTEVEETLPKWLEQGELDLFGAASKLVTAITVRCFMGEQIRAQYGDRVAAAYETLENHARSFMAALLPGPISPSARKAANARKDIYNILSIVIDDYRKGLSKDPNELRYLKPWIDHRFGDGGSFNTDAMMSHLLALIFSVHTNTAGLLGWTLGELLIRPQLLAQTIGEQDAFAASKECLESLQDLRALPLLDRCAKECARLHLTPILVRKAAKPFVAEAYEIPAGDLVCISPILAHLNPEAFPEPDRFDPDRFLDEAVLKKHVQDANFIPFGMGTHRCLGEHFANAVHKTVCHTILRRLELSLVEDTLPPPNWRDGGTAWPLRPVRVRVKERALA